MGAGHDTVAGELARRARERGWRPRTVDVLRLLPYGLGGGLRRFYQASVRHAPWTYAALYRGFMREGPGRRPSGVPLARLAGERLLRCVERSDADVVVPVFHLAAQLTGHLRERGALEVPSAVFLLDFAVHRQWLHPGNDAYLCVSEEAARRVREATGTRAWVTGPVVAPEFTRAGAGGPGGDAGAVRWRERFERFAPGRPPVLLSAGAWGALNRPAETARLLAAAGWLPVVLCGRNTRLFHTLAGEPDVLPLGWTPDMPALLAACHALIDNAAGQTAVQALAAGLPVIGHRPLPGHGAEGVGEMAALGLTRYAPDAHALLAALTALAPDTPAGREAVARGRALFTGVPDAMDCVAELAGRRPGRFSRTSRPGPSPAG
ncbi:galactosyldiacylglycerol synthase [Streptomyces sp. J2-1]|nr:galactosyldiacylglycerol synthase [Streptomyces corallincola]MBV2354013.1 galactosyldiacylglycerol synthase [Streptomyces corallincola]